MPRATLDEIARSERIALFAHFHPTNLVADHVLLYLRALAHAGFKVVVVTTCDLSEDDTARLASECAYLIKRENTGLDFGGWIEALRQLPPLQANLLLLTNDSVYGPVGDLAAFIESLLSVPADFYGAVESLEHGRHLQSWFLLFRPSAYTSPAFKRLLGRPIDSGVPKLDIIKGYEVGLSQSLHAEGLVSHAAYRPHAHSLFGQIGSINASHLLWRELIDKLRIPFLKVQLLRDNPHHIVNLDQWSHVVDRFNPALRAAISSDLSVRESGQGVSKKVAWRETLRENNPFLWPELQSFLRRDFAVWPKPVRSNLNRFGFRLAIRAAKLVRRVAAR